MNRSHARVLALAALVSLLSACGGGGGGGGGTGGGGGGGTPPTSNPTSAFACPTADSTTAAGVGGGSATETSHHRFVAHASAAQPGLVATVAVTYERTAALAAPLAIASREQAAGGTPVLSLDFSHVDRVTHMLTVPPDEESAVIARLRSEPGVVSVNDASARRFAQTVSSAYVPDDPYYDGFATTTPPTPSATAPPATNNYPPYYERNDVPGQWDMHQVGLGYAMEYSQSGNGSSVQNSGALGSSSVKIAIIDTGQDTGHPELHSKIVYQKCYITDSGVQSTSNFTTDPDGHGTDVSGIAAAEMNNGLGFVGDGGNVVLYAYRVFPTPDNNCSNPNTTDPQCSATLQDIASAINDAVHQGVNVISMSFGGPCPDSAPESTAVANAVAAGVVVVAAAGNGGSSGVDAPGCDNGVIAVGASALDDGQPNGTSGTGGNAGGTSSSPKEYVASYSQYGSPAKAANSATAWGIVAPGGDAANDQDTDDLHWIENIWTSTPYDQATDGGNCDGDYPSDTGTSDCRILIDGTSMATPHVAGAAGLILSVNSSYQSATAMKTLLCQTADDIGDAHEGCGRLDVYRAMAKALSDPVSPTPIP